MKKQFDKRVEVSLYLERTQYEELVKRVPEDQSISGLLRHLVTTYLEGEFAPEGGEPRRAEESTMVEVGHPAEMPASPKPPKGVRTCEHGTEEGYRCWQCGGKAKVK